MMDSAGISRTHHALWNHDLRCARMGWDGTVCGSIPPHSALARRSGKSRNRNATGLCCCPADNFGVGGEGGLKAADIMVRDVVTVKPNDDVASAIELLAKHDVS